MADTFATLRKDASINSKNVSNMLGQLSLAQKDVNLSLDDRMGLSAAYANVYTRGNVEGVLNSEITSDYGRFAFFGALTSGGASLGKPLPLNPSIIDSPRDVGTNGLRQTGAGSGVNAADDLYNVIRADTTDVAKIAENTGINRRIFRK